MALELWVIWAGRRAQDAWESLAADYARRIEPFHPLVERAIRVPAAGDDPSRLRAEGRALAAAAPPDALRIALDRTGRALDSDAWQAEVERWRREWSRPVVFFVGSDLGLDSELLASCRMRLSFGPLTLPHALARLVLLEQIYRALARGAGHPYHR